jgi:hydrogenase maturation factor
MSACDDAHCITCSDEAVPMRVTEVRPDGIAFCGEAEVMTELVGDVAPGDELLVHAGAAIARAT